MVQYGRRKQIKGMDIDMGCDYCREAVERIEHGDVGPLEIIVIKPDINGSGIETHRHVEIFKVNNEGRLLDDAGAVVDELLHPGDFVRAMGRYGKDAYGRKKVI